MAYCTFLRILTTTSAYIRLFVLTPVKTWVKWTKIGSIVGPKLSPIGPKEPKWIGVPILIVENQDFGSLYIFENSYKFWDSPSSMFLKVPIFIVETCPFGSSHRFDCYHHPQGMSEVILIPYQHPYGQFGAVRGYNTDGDFCFK